MLTTPYAKLVPTLFDIRHRDRERDYRLGYTIAFWSGLFLGAVIVKYSWTWAVEIVAILLKSIVLVIVAMVKTQAP